MYAVVAYAIGVEAGVPTEFAPLMYVRFSLWIFACAFVAAAGVMALVSREPFAWLQRAVTSMTEPRTAANLLLFATICLHMGIFTSVKTMLPDIHPFQADRTLADLDEALFGIAPWKVTTALLPTWLTPVACNLYFGVWGLLMPACLLVCVFTRRLRAMRDQYLWTHLIMWPLLGNVIAGACMSAGPVYYGLVTGDAGRFAGLVAFLAHFRPLAEGTAYLWQASTSGQVTPAGGVSAFPSLHLANATMFALLANRLFPRLRWAAFAFVGVILVLSVHLGWHYAVDGLFSIVVTVALWRVIGQLLALRAARVTAAQPRIA